MDPLKIYDYLAASRLRVLDAAGRLSDDQWRRQFAYGMNSIARTLTHVMVSEWYYIQRLHGRELPPYEQWPIRDEEAPGGDVIERTWREQASQTRAALAAERDWSRRIEWIGFPNAHGKRFHVAASAADLFTQLAFHEIHHRAQVMAMLRELGHPVQDLDYNATRFERRPV